jgi:RNA polymerase sigma factor (sigma-70 family)
MNESEAISAAQLGDPVGFTRLYELHHKNVINRCRQILRNEDEAQDISQEVFLLLWQKINLFRYQSAFSSWLFRLTSNKAISHIRSRKTKPQAGDAEPPETTQLPDQLSRLEIQEAFRGLSEMERFCIEAEMNGQSVRHHGGANYLRSAARELKGHLR